MNSRQQSVLDLLCRYGELTVPELSRLLGVSPLGVRRELSKLDGHRLVRRTRGGAALRTVVDADPALTLRPALDPQEVRAIAWQAYQLIEPSSVVGLMGGRICTQLGLHLRFLRNITVVTNAVNVAVELAGLPGVRVHVTGGRLGPGSFELVGAAFEASLNNLRMNQLFLGTSGLSVQHGMMVDDEQEAAASRLMMERADAAYILADSSKFNKGDLSRVTAITPGMRIITTERTPSAVRDEFAAVGAEITVARLEAEL